MGPHRSATPTGGASTSSRKDFDLMCQVLIKLSQFSKTRWRSGIENSSLPKAAIDGYYHLVNQHSPISSEEVEKLVQEWKASKKMRFYLNYLFLPPLQDNSEFIPILSLDYNFEPPYRHLSFRIEMHRLITEQEAKIHCVGFRFEIGEPGSDHDYHHVQLTSRRRNWEGGQALPQCPVWMPVKVPRIPMPVSDPVALILSVVVSLYGTAGPRQMLPDVMRGVDRKYLNLLSQAVGPI